MSQGASTTVLTTSYSGGHNFVFTGGFSIYEALLLAIWIVVNINCVMPKLQVLLQATKIPSCRPIDIIVVLLIASPIDTCMWASNTYHKLYVVCILNNCWVPILYGGVLFIEVHILCYNGTTTNCPYRGVLIS